MSELHEVAGTQLAVRALGVLGDQPTIVMLHEGLGSITQWHDLPEQIHGSTGLPVVAYDRGGYGRSPLDTKYYDPEFMHREALETLPALLKHLGVQRPVLFGHSDGGTISLIAATSPEVAPLAVITIAAHIFVEPAVVKGVGAAKARRNQIVKGMSRHHDNAGATFDRWANVWLDPLFAKFDICSILSRITCPLLILQGDRDEYATEEMVHGVTQRVPQALGRFIPDCGHIAHRDQPEALVENLGGFLMQTGVIGQN